VLAPNSKLMRTQYLHSCRLIIFLCVAAFGPYVVPAAGLRLEHFVIYGSLFYLVMLRILSHGNTTIPKNIFLLAILCLAVPFWVLLVSLENLSWARPYNILAALENFTQPAALVVVMFLLMQPLDRLEKLNLLRVAGITIIVMLFLNSLIAMLTIFYNTWPFVRYFTVAGDVGFEIVPVWQRAASMGRFSGIFNQPVEAGLVYSLGMLCWVYLATTSKRISSIGWLSLIMIIIGGVLAVSKSFILGGFPLAILYWLTTALNQSLIRKSTVIGLMIWGFGGMTLAIFLAHSWSGLDYFLRFFRSDSYDKSVVHLITSGRFGGGEESITAPLFIKTWSESPIMGFGVPSRFSNVLDNAYIEFFLYGGVVGLAFYAAILVSILSVALSGLRNDPKLGRLLIAVWILIIGTGLGAPVITLNRSSICLWVILVIIFAALSKTNSRGKA